MNAEILEYLTKGEPYIPSDAAPPITIRMPFPYVGPHGCDLCGWGTVDPAVTFDPSKPCPECGATFATDFRAIVRSALAEPNAPSQQDVAVAVAPTWGVKVDSAVSLLSAWLNGKRDQLPLVAVQAIFDALRRKVVAHEEPADVVVFVNNAFRREARCASRSEAERYAEGARYVVDLVDSRSVAVYVLPFEDKKMVREQPAAEVARARERLGRRSE
jgi:hypothetical protein